MTEITGAERLSEEMALPTPNLPLLRKVLDHIDAHPEEWNQQRWVEQTACGTAYCIAGHALAMTGHALLPSTESGYASDVLLDGAESESCETTDGRYEMSVATAARAELGLTYHEGDALFHERNTRADVGRIAEQIAARAGEVL